MPVSVQLHVADHILYLVTLTAQPHQQIGTNIGMYSHTRQYTLQLLYRLATMLHGTATFVRETDDTIDVGIIAQQFWGKTSLDITYGRRRTIDGADNSNVVTCAHFAIRTAVAHERALLFGRNIVHRAHINTILVSLL